MNQKIYLIAKNLKKQISNYQFDLYQQRDAKKRLKNIELVKGKTDRKLIKLSDEYAKDVFGWIGYAPWLYAYSAMAETFKEGWIPDNYYGKVVIPKLQGDYGKLSFLKATTTNLFDNSVFPDIVYYANGLFNSSYNQVISETNLKKYLFKNTKTVVFKKDYSLQGLGVFFFDKNSFEIKQIHRLGNGVFQEFIHQHPFFEEFITSSVSTLRITTVIDNNGIASVKASFIRMGQKNDTHVNAVTDIIVAVNIYTGELDEFGYVDNWQPLDRHPDTKIKFSKKRIPAFNKCVKTALELHRKVPFVRCIGWDMTVDKEENVKVMEWNGYHNDIKFCEATQGPCFSDLGWENLWRQAKNK